MLAKNLKLLKLFLSGEGILNVTAEDLIRKKKKQELTSLLFKPLNCKKCNFSMITGLFTIAVVLQLMIIFSVLVLMNHTSKTSSNDYNSVFFCYRALINTMLLDLF